MGLIRLLLAVAVLSAHSGQILSFHFPGGSTAVRIFFMISGFYMALILSKKYLRLHNGYRLFITNRFLRLYPIYWIILLLTFIVCVVGYVGFNEPFLLAPFLKQTDWLNPLSWFLVIVSNLIIFLQSALSFLSFYQGDILWISNSNGIPGWHFLLVPQAWSIGLELSFYCVAPFFVKRSTGFVLISVIACYAVIYLLHIIETKIGFYGPWGQRFFPSGFMYFLCGVLTYKLFEDYLRKYFTNTIAIVMLVSWIATTLFYLYLPQQSEIGYLIYFGISFVSIPFVFELTNKWKWDRFIGEFSYPVYLSQYVFIGLVAYAFKKYQLPEQWMSEVALVVTMVVSFLLLRFVSIPIDRIREERFLRSRDKSLSVETEALDKSMSQTGELKGVINADKQI